MWVRKRLDIGWRDLAYGCARCAVPSRSTLADQTIADDWIPENEVLVCLSVRSGLDLLLSAGELPAGSEVLLSAINIPDMAHIVRRHGLSPRVVDVEVETFHPTAEAVRRAITPRTRMILIAHLFGSRSHMGPIAAVADHHGIPLVEDCAQAFCGRTYAGHPAAAVSLFSFGPIKTATALGGAVLRVKDQSLRDRMRRLQQQYPLQRSGRYLARILKYAVFKLLTPRPVYGGVLRALRLFGADHDEFVHRRHRSFGRSASLLKEVRFRPCEPLKHVPQRRLARFNPAALAARRDGGCRLAQALIRQGLRPLPDQPGNTYWVFPYLTNDRDGLAKWLLARGFDIVRQSSLAALEPSPGEGPAPLVAAQLLESLVFLPAYPEMPAAESQRLAELVSQFEAQHVAGQKATTGSAA